MNAVAQFGRVVLSLAVVLCLMWGLARFVKRPTRGRDGRLMDIMGRQQLSRNSSLAVVRVLNQALIVGVTDGQISLLGEVDLAEAEAQLELAAPLKKSRKTVPTGAVVEPSPSLTRPARPVPSSARITIPADVPGADLLSKKTSLPATSSQVTKHGRIGTPKTAQDAKSSPLSGSALSPATWRQAVESLRDLTVRSR